MFLCCNFCHGNSEHFGAYRGVASGHKKIINFDFRTSRANVVMVTHFGAHHQGSSRVLVVLAIPPEFCNNGITRLVIN